MTGRKSGRIKKNLDYTAFLENDKSDESDDDFVGNSAPPPLKKVKSSQEENIKKPENVLTPEKQKDNHASKSTKSKRKKLDEKIFEREIKMAMELSLQTDGEVVSENTPESKSSPCKIKSKTNEPQPRKELLYLSRHDIHSPPKSPPVLTLSACGDNEEKEKKSANKPPAMPILTPVNGPSDDIEFLGLNDEDERKQTRNRRTSGRTAKKMIVYKPEDSDDDEQGSNDEVKKQTRNRRTSARNAKETIEYKPKDSDNDSDDDDDSEFEEEESNSEENSDFEEKPKGKKQKQVLSTKVKKESKKQSQSITSNRVQQKTETKKTPPPPSSSSSSSSSSRPSLTLKSVNSTNSVKSVTKSVSSTEGGNSTSSLSRHKTETVSECVTSVKIPCKMQTSTPLGKSVRNLTNMASPPSIRRLGLSRNQKVKPLHPTLKVNY